MKAIGIALLFSALVMGGGFVANFMTRMAETECAKACPEAEDAMKSIVQAGPFELAMCECPAGS